VFLVKSLIFHHHNIIMMTKIVDNNILELNTHWKDENINRNESTRGSTYFKRKTKLKSLSKNPLWLEQNPTIPTQNKTQPTQPKSKLIEISEIITKSRADNLTYLELKSQSHNYWERAFSSAAFSIPLDSLECHLPQF